MNLSMFILTLRTIYYLRPIQLYWRVWLKISKPSRSDFITRIDVSSNFLVLVDVIERPVSYRNSGFIFLNHFVLHSERICWNDLSREKLWLYNLHYFDYLQQPGLDKGTALTLIGSWIKHNSVGEGEGWDSYPLSLRIINWVKFISRIGSSSSDEIEQSLYFQTRWLRCRLEFHLLGNHLLKNAVALLFAGRAFSGAEAQGWYKAGRRLLFDQLAEQVLPDGGHFERSPMYHALVLEDVLDCLNVIRSNDDFSDHALDAFLTDKASRMLCFLLDIIHPDKSLPVFNDTAQGISAELSELVDYARRLNISVSTEESSLTEKPEFGLYLLRKMDWHCIIDAGKIGPDYLPGHAHCDTLSYELSLRGNRIIVNAGVYQYAGNERNKYRSTCSHNTVEIDGVDQHEMWATFRVARRGYPQAISVVENNEALLFSAQHTGYQRLRGKPLHQRDVRLTNQGLTVVDKILASRNHLAKNYIHFHPNVELLSESRDGIECVSAGSIFNLVFPSDCNWRIEEYAYSEQFGLKQSSSVVVIENQGLGNFSFTYSIFIDNANGGAEPSMV